MRTGWVVVVLVIFASLTVRRNLQWTDSYELIKLHRDRFPEDSDIASRMAVEEYGRGNVKEARRLGREAVRLEENGSVNSYYAQARKLNNATNLAVMELAMRDGDAALVEARRALALDGGRRWHDGRPEENGMALGALMTARMVKGDGAAAVEAAKRLVAAQPEAAASWAGLRDALTMAGDTEWASLADERRAQIAAQPVDEGPYEKPIRWAPAEAAVMVYALMVGLAFIVVVSVTYAWKTVRGQR